MPALTLPLRLLQVWQRAIDVRLDRLSNAAAAEHTRHIARIVPNRRLRYLLHVLVVPLLGLLHQPLHALLLTFLFQDSVELDGFLPLLLPRLGHLWKPVFSATHIQILLLLLLVQVVPACLLKHLVAFGDYVGGDLGRFA